MNQEKLLVLIINDMVIFPNNEIRIEYDNTFDKPMINIIDQLDSDLMLIVNPIEEGEDIDLTNLPNYGTLGRLKLKMNVPNGKTRVVIDGLKRVEISNYSKEELETKMHNYELKKDEFTNVRIDYKVSGIGSGSCGPQLMEKYQMNDTKIKFNFTIRSSKH